MQADPIESLIDSRLQPLKDRIVSLENVIAKGKDVSELSWHGPLTENEQRVLRLEAARQITELERENARFRHNLDLIRRFGGTTTDEGVPCNGSWCAEQAASALQYK